MRLSANFFRPIYNYVLRNKLPRKIGVYNGIPVRRPRLLDKNDVFPEYEEALLNQINQHAKTNDSILLVGGGLGVSTVYAARNGENVTVYEPSKKRSKIIKETIQLNNISGNVTVHNKAVETVVNMEGTPSGNEPISASELPSCDLLVMDCEGAEEEILENIKIRPSRIVVETHPMFDSHPNKIRKKLRELQYKVTDSEKEVTDRGTITILAASKKSN